jgi:cytochrome c-type biogenesis protein CcmH
MIPAHRVSRDGLLIARVLAYSIVVLAVAGPVFAQEPASPAILVGWVEDKPPAPGERALEGRILAPCCYTQTLDVHQSEPARDLRLEIRRRLYAGERVEAIEQSLVDRYGERLRAVAAGDPMGWIAAVLLLVMSLAGLLVLQLLRRWQSRSQHASGMMEPLSMAAVDADDERLDAELRDLD